MGDHQSSDILVTPARTRHISTVNNLSPKVPPRPLKKLKLNLLQRFEVIVDSDSDEV